MKSFNFFSAIAITFLTMLVFVASCSRCVKCKKGNSETSFCESSYSSEAAFNAEVTELEAKGYVCSSN